MTTANPWRFASYCVRKARIGSRSPSAARFSMSRSSVWEWTIACAHLSHALSKSGSSPWTPAAMYRYPPRMADEQRQEPTERTPKGLEVRVPERREFFGNLKKAAKPDEPKKGPPPEP